MLITITQRNGLALCLHMFALMTCFSQAPNWEMAGNFGGNDNDECMSMTVDSSGYVYMTGRFEGTVDFDIGLGVSTLTSVNGDAFVSKSDNNGVLIWVRKLSGWANDHGIDISVDSAGNVYTIGEFRGNVDFNPGPGTYNIVTDDDDIDLYIWKLNQDGNFIWAKNITAVNSVDAFSMSVDWHTGDVYVAGSLEGTMDVNPGAQINNLSVSSNNGSFILKLNSAGEYVWAKPCPYWINSLGTDQTNGDLYFTGLFQYTVDFDQGPAIYELTAGPTAVSDLFVQRWDSTANFIWPDQ